VAATADSGTQQHWHTPPVQHWAEIINGTSVRVHLSPPTAALVTVEVGQCP
jgi:hypothetical protein